MEGRPTAPAGGTQVVADAEDVRRFALVFLPGMGDRWIDQSIGGIAARVADALNQRASRPQARVIVDPKVREETFGHDRKTSACTIKRIDDGRPTAAIDLYKLDGVRALRGTDEEQSFIRKSLLPALILWAYIPRAFRARRGGAKSGRERWQFNYAVLALALMTIYLVVLLATAAVSVLDAVNPDWTGVIPDRALDGWQSVVVVLTTLGLWKSSFWSNLADGAVGHVAVTNYLDHGDRQQNLVGEFTALLEHLVDKDDVSYERVDVIAFSFGSIVALDAFFPADQAPGPRVSAVDTLVTIGCPFDFIRAYWPRYFASRTTADAVPKQWLNVYMPLDVLASNFRDDTSVGGPATVGIPTGTQTMRMPENIVYRAGKTIDDLTLRDFLAFLGFRSHSVYWGRTFESEATAFSPVVDRMYVGEPLLA